MRILQIVHGFPPDAWAGTELVSFYLSRALHDHSHQVTVLTRTEESGASEFSVREERMDGIDVIRVVNNHSRTASFRLFYENSFYDELFSRLLERVRPDVVHFQHLAHFSVSLLSFVASRGYPTVLSLHDFFFPCHRIHLIDSEERLCPGPNRGERCVSCLHGVAPEGEIRRRFVSMEEALHAPDVILTASRFFHDKVQSYFPSIEERLHLVPLGVPPFACKERKPRAHERLRLLYSGLLFPPKGAHVLVEALRGLPAEAIETSLYGATLPFWQPYVDRLQESGQGLSVYFRGSYSHDRIGEILAEHDVLAMPMVCEETFSLLAREALVAGLPVVAARRGALPEIIQDGVNGLLFQPENAADLRHCLRRLIEEPDLVERLRPVEFHTKTMAEYAQEMEEIYTKAIVEKVAKDRSLPNDAMQRRSSEEGRAWDAAPLKTPVSVSVLIPTKNGERYIAEVIAGIRRQQGELVVKEILVVDSGSRDQTVSILRRLGVTVLQIPPYEFGHGKTRNLLASHATGELLVFLTQDATPANEQWLANLIAPLQTDSLLAGAYSRHLPRPNCHPMEWHRIIEYELHGRPESRVQYAVGNPDYARNPDFYHFFANTSSVLRRSVWEQIPFPDVEFAEDQGWAERVLSAGYKTMYTADSIVFHSHSYGPWTNFCRHFEHFSALRLQFSRPPSHALGKCVSSALQVAQADLVFWRRERRQPKFQLLLHWAVPAVCWHLAANLGIWLGERADFLPSRLVRFFSLQERLKRR